MTAIEIMGGAVIVAVSYPVIMRLLADAVQPTRLKMADLGNDLLRDSTLSPIDKMVVQSMMEDAFEWRFMIYAVIKAPQYAWARICGHPIPDSIGRIPSRESRTMMRQMVEYFTLSTAAANPLFFIIASVEIFLGSILLRLVDGFGKESNNLRAVCERVIMKAENAFSHEPTFF